MKESEIRVTEALKEILEKSEKALTDWEIFQESDWKCFIYAELTNRLCKMGLNDNYSIHTEVGLKGYGKNDKCDLAVFYRDKIRIQLIGEHTSKSTRGVRGSSFAHPGMLVAATELKMHGGRSKKWDNSQYREKEREFIRDTNRLVNTDAQKVFAWFIDGEAALFLEVERQRRKKLEKEVNKDKRLIWKYLALDR